MSTVIKRFVLASFTGVRPRVVRVHESLGFGRVRTVLQVTDTRVDRDPDGRNPSRPRSEQSDSGASLAAPNRRRHMFPIPLTRSVSVWFSDSCPDGRTRSRSPKRCPNRSSSRPLESYPYAWYGRDSVWRWRFFFVYYCYYSPRYASLNFFVKSFFGTCIL